MSGGATLEAEGVQRSNTDVDNSMHSDLVLHSDHEQRSGIQSNRQSLSSSVGSISEQPSNENVGYDNNSALKRSERSRQLSLVEKESKLLELNRHLVKCITAQLIDNEELLSEIESLEISHIEQAVSNLKQNFDVINVVYNEINTISEKKT